MPSVPQSLLWISLVVLWLFVLVPMLISKRDAVRRTSDVALATRVLNSAASARRLRRGAPAAGHRSDPDWQPADDLADDEDSDEDFHDDKPSSKTVVARRVADAATTEPDYLDVDVVEEDSGALPVGSTQCAHELTDTEPDAESTVDAEAGRALGGDAEDEYLTDEQTEPDDTSEEYEYVEDTSGLESVDDPPTIVSPSVSRRRRYDPQAAAAASARKYRFRKRVVMVLALTLAASGLAAATLWPTGWWVCGSTGVITVLYLIYLRRQTRIEEQLHRRRMQRLARSRLGVENTEDHTFEVVPSRLRRPGAVVLEIDDEDPDFEHLDHASAPDEYDLPKAAGQ